MFSCQICDIYKNTYLEEHLQTTASKHRSSFLEVFCRNCCSVEIVMKYSFSAAEECSMEIYEKLHSITGIFQRISSQLQNSNIEKCILMAASEDDFILEIFLHGCFSKAAAGYIRSRNSYTYFTFLTLTSC